MKVSLNHIRNLIIYKKIFAIAWLVLAEILLRTTICGIEYSGVLDHKKFQKYFELCSSSFRVRIR